MSSRARIDPIVLALLSMGCLALAGHASAAVQCPASSGGQPLRVLGGGSLYLGPIEDNMVQAPDGTQQGPNGSINTWRFRSAEGMKLVCRYEGTSSAVVMPLAAETRMCRQEARLRSFVCQ